MTVHIVSNHKTMGFPAALAECLTYRPIARLSWAADGRDGYIIKPSLNHPALGFNHPTLLNKALLELRGKRYERILLRCAVGRLADLYLPTHDDIFADDWFVVGNPDATTLTPAVAVSDNEVAT